jgi:prolipoprotein diacylglyceryltransferase
MLSLPMIALGVVLLLVAYRRQSPDPNTAPHTET